MALLHSEPKSVLKAATFEFLATDQPSPCYNPNTDNVNYDKTALEDDQQNRDKLLVKLRFGSPLPGAPRTAEGELFNSLT